MLLPLLAVGLLGGLAGYAVGKSTSSSKPKTQPKEKPKPEEAPKPQEIVKEIRINAPTLVQSIVPTKAKGITTAQRRATPTNRNVMLQRSASGLERPLGLSVLERLLGLSVYNFQKQFGGRRLGLYNTGRLR
jgi:hypothetical protein